MIFSIADDLRRRTMPSMITGWHRATWEHCAEVWLSTIRDYAGPGHARPWLPGPVTVDGPVREGMETICRSALLVAPLLAGRDTDTDTDGHAAWYRRAIVSGTEPGGPEAWPWAVHCRTPLQGVTQSLVEAANLAFALFVGRRQLWDPLSPAEQDQVADWLAHHARLMSWQNNWLLFPALCEGFLVSVGRSVEGGRGARNVARVESWYLGDGWYTDGPEHAVDYYNAWTIHPFLWAWYRMTEQTQTPADRRRQDRLAAFAAGFESFVAQDGSPIHFGRSLTYRTALLAALWCAEIDGVNPLTPGRTRRLASGVLARFVDRGVGADGLLRPGWYGEHAGTVQSYSGFGSAYLAGIGFLGLSLPSDHPVWTAEEEPLTGDDHDHQLPLAEVGWHVSHTQQLARLTNHGSDHVALPVGDGIDPDDPHYAKFSYSTHTAPGTGGASDDNVDGHLALVDAAGLATRRGALRGSRTSGTVSGSVHIPQRARRTVTGSAVITVSIDHGPFELRCHLVSGAAGTTIREGGHAVAGASAPSADQESDGTVWVANAERTLSALTPIAGWQTGAVHRYTGCHAMGAESAVASLSAPGSDHDQLLIALHTLTRSDLAPSELRRQVRVEIDDTTVTARWHDDETSEMVNLATFVTDWDQQRGGRRGQ